MMFKGYRIHPMFWVYAMGIALNILAFAISHLLFNLLMEAIFIYILVYKWNFLVEKVKVERPNFEDLRIDK